MENKHISVLLKESIKILNIQENGTYVDCTLGRGGHSTEILKCLKKGHLYSIDQDDEAIKYSKNMLELISSNFTILKGNFINIKSLLYLEGITKVNGILYDLGVSSPHLDDAERGFSYRFDSELDMRMDNINTKITAKDLVNSLSESELSRIFFKYGDEKFANKIAKNICLYREKKEIKTTFQLVEIIKSSIPQKFLKQKKHPAKKTFQALRIQVNNEIECLEKSLYQAVDILDKNAVLAIITFHSLEEKIVKEIFHKLTFNKDEKFYNKLPINIKLNKNFEVLTKRPIKPSLSELEFNNRSHSAKLWAIKKVGDENV
ncbi:16S rRNA (cytosine(1402)-N(4))-methyltransferase RsmH [Spiroplasma turonicum]|uniref:Ribosomal RNA small subunit methyltransferase H n=1 Tax=Spiroplasma turonicum TaxID=216946 RepID=A0A0K1P5B5_9MOLU|nr:16S rRNA (cytosine(1402)-N(4))-methyltransferase RsmH [Spiroplasma turonicum]AKU79481.1 S-adenosyl-methyltransferase MraW [Spiroplasma turonicum]ALX70502.1 S-adenosyl-methyltransferase MraW [Spiroplasma turonicum]